MASQIADLEVLKEIPGYKAIMKAVLKTQIQLLVEQLSDHTGEESIVLTASINDGSLSHLGSFTGKGFLEGRDEIKSQFLGYCLKSHHKRKTQETPAPYQRSNVSHPGPRTPQHQQSAKKPRLHPVSLSRVSAGSDIPVMMPDQRASVSLSGDDSDSLPAPAPARSRTQSQRASVSEDNLAPSRTLSSDSDNARSVKLEQTGDTIQSGDNMPSSETDFTASTSLPSSIRLSHTQTSENVGQSDHEKEGLLGSGDTSQDSPGIKVEPVTESELDLEITGIEMGDGSSQLSSENWGQNVSGGFAAGTSDDNSFDQSGSQPGYNASKEKETEELFVPPPSQPVFPGQLSPTTSTPQFDLCGFDSSQAKMNNESHKLGKSLTKADGTESISSTLDNLSTQLFLGQDPVSIFKSQYAQAQMQSQFRLGRPPGIYTCKYCGKVMQNKSVFDYHVRTHTGEKPYKCDVCQRHFAGRQPLETHQRLHTGERPFKCDICFKSFPARSGRDYHKRKHHMMNEFMMSSFQP